MKLNTTIKSFVAVAILAATASCKPNMKDVTPSKGTADFSRYIAVGNSLTAGYADNGLYLEGQKNSYPEMLSTQMKTVGGGAFYTPFFDEAEANGTGYLQFSGFSATGSPNLTPVTTNLATKEAMAPTPTFNKKYAGTEISNFGVPGIKLKHYNIAGYGFGNGYFNRLLPQASAFSNYIDFVTAKPYTFFSLWLGNNDILLYATHGAVTIGDDSPTDKSEFAEDYNDVVKRLTANGAKGVVATIPYVASTPYFNTVTLAALTAAVGGKGIYIQPGSGAARLATAADKFVLTLTSANVIGKPNGAGIPYGLYPQNPIASNFVLDVAEQADIKSYIDSYNTTITNVAKSKGLAVMDANGLLNQFSTPQVINGATISNAFITGNLFSLDGIHLTPMGYAIAANGFIKAINQTYGSSLSIVDITKFRGVKFPASATAAQ
jgi:hypothetical protein